MSKVQEEAAGLSEELKPRGTAKRKKVNHACVYCRRSHMTCDSERPCSRCVKRNIDHLCHDEVRETKPKSPKKDTDSSPSTALQSSVAPTENRMNDFLTDSQRMRPPAITRTILPTSPALPQMQSLPQSQSPSASTETFDDRHAVPSAKDQDPSASVEDRSGVGQSPSISTAPAVENHFINEFSSLYDTTLGLPPDSMSHFASEHTNSEFLVLSDFLNIISPPAGTLPTSPTPGHPFSYPALAQLPEIPEDRLTNEQQMALRASSMKYTKNASIPQSRGASNNPSRVQSRRPSVGAGAININTNDTTKLQEKFFLTAADPVPDSAEERLKQVINAKVEAGLVKPFDYVRGYARLQKYMDVNMSPDSRSRILAPLSKFRPAFRAIAKKLTDVDLILVEEAFERLLLDYDRVFTSMAVPACLWRRTGEIFRGNKEFAALLNLPRESLRDGKLAITELMAEDSAVSYWEKYGNVAFDGREKAVLTTCLLQVPGDSRGAIVTCCFSFTIKRDRYNIPSCIVGNFIPISF